jgi:peptidoglycan/xylan/chitin deacetylase (PgdA/CDA1 family)
MENESKSYTPSRRDFLRAVLVGGSALVLNACAKKMEAIVPPIQTPRPVDPTNSPTANESPTDAPTPKPKPEPTEKPFVPEIERQLEKWGPAEMVPVFEYHGDNYDMYDGRYAMTPESFKAQMNWFKDNDFHAVTGPELTAFLDKKIDLPKRSIILTTDSGKGSINSLPRMIPVLKETGMHFNSFIWTAEMPPNSPTWDWFELGVKEGVLTIGSHSERHADFAKYTPYGVVSELKQSKKKIEDRLGIIIDSISWPLESCPASANDLTTVGYRYAFGGYSRDSFANLAVKKGDKNPFCLPRIFPPNPEGITMRPKGLSLQETVELYMGEKMK